MRKAALACILPILTYGAPAWWPVRTRTNREEETIQNGMETNCRKLDKAQNAQYGRQEREKECGRWTEGNI